MSPSRRRRHHHARASMTRRCNTATTSACRPMLPARSPPPPGLPENVALLERYRRLAFRRRRQPAWSSAPSTSPWPGTSWGWPQAHPQLDLETDLQPAMDYIHAKGVGPDWTEICRNCAGQVPPLPAARARPGRAQAPPYEPRAAYPGLACLAGGGADPLPAPLQRNWRAARLEENIRRFWSGHLRIWRFLCRAVRRAGSSPTCAASTSTTTPTTACSLGNPSPPSTPTCATSAASCVFLQEEGLRRPAGSAAHPRPQTARPPAQVPDRRAGAPAAR